MEPTSLSNNPITTIISDKFLLEMFRISMNSNEMRLKDDFLKGINPAEPSISPEDHIVVLNIHCSKLTKYFKITYFLKLKNRQFAGESYKGSNQRKLKNKENNRKLKHILSKITQFG